jgi:hypothetical protein
MIYLKDPKDSTKTLRSGNSSRIQNQHIKIMTAKTWKHPKCTSTDVKKLWYVSYGILFSLEKRRKSCLLGQHG